MESLDCPTHSWHKPFTKFFRSRKERCNNEQHPKEKKEVLSFKEAEFMDKILEWIEVI